MSDAENTPAVPQQAADTTASTAEIHAGIKAKFDNLVDIKPTKFHFKKVKDELGNETKRPTVEIDLPVPSVEGIIDIIQNLGGNALALLQEAVYEVIATRARDIINEKEDITQATFPFEALSWNTIANLPKAERRGGGISKDTWEAFTADYIAVMPGATGKAVDKIENAAKILASKFSTVKTAKPILKVLKDQLSLYLVSTPRAEEFAECVEFLLNKADALINVNDADLLNNL